LIFVPSVLTYLRSYFDDIRLEKVKYSLFCGEALYDELVEEWVRCTPFSEVLNTYGPTEATVFCFLYGWRASAVGEKSYQGMVSIGRALGSTEVLVVDEHLNGVGVGAKGELCLSGEQVTVGYWNNEEKNRQSFFVKDGRRYYRTGDLVFVDGDGDYMFCGRIDFQVKVNGYRVELSEIEHQVRVFTHSSQVVVVACERVGGGVVLVLFLEGYEGDIGLLLSYLRSKLPVYMIPSEVRVLEAFPLNKNGKVDRNELRRMVK
jgi:acyl-coenzyme A synthetase/AMP-(fatty) acid ligase